MKHEILVETLQVIQKDSKFNKTCVHSEKLSVDFQKETSLKKLSICANFS